MTNLLLSRQEAAQLLQHRRECRTRFQSWCIEALAPFNQTPAAHHRLLIQELQDVADRNTRKLMFFLPPGSAKSRYGSELFPPFMMARSDYFNVLAGSHTKPLADKFSRRCQQRVVDNFRTLGIGLRTENVDRWETTNGGEYMASGVGTGIAGFRGNLGLIDDPVKNREAADSEAERERAWNWYLADFVPRLVPQAAQIIIMTRWHRDDLAGRILETEGDLKEGGQWRVVKVPAIAGVDDPLGRDPGDYLWDDDAYGYAKQLRETYMFYTRTGGMRDWQALYQQEPTLAEGNIFKVGTIRTIDAEPAGGQSVRAWDFGATAKIGTRDPDWTRGVKIKRTDAGRYVICHVAGLRGGPDEVERLVVNTASQDGHSVRIGIPQDPGQAGKVQVLYLTRKLAGYNVDSSPETGDKATRASPFASQCNVGNVDIVRGEWNKPYLDELGAFPSGTHDDMVDATSRGFGMIATNRPPMMISDEALRSAGARAGM